ncbi:hypothetical protein LTS18_010868 [Coniosporium uncinatum]|uniref:Uncharacterized protein n=1 Tax=Coniosporium uncinatum TaxID=93489 RepID=A0ACC3D9W5_9PEZI|nr:hypothetical protein LTS18_010868 [Coniosporium uncinatum]
MFIIIEVALAIAFGVMNRQSHWNRAAILEWIIALVYFFYVLSYFMDFLPATHSKYHQSRENNMEMAMNEDSAVAETSAAQMDGDGGRYYGNGATNNYGASDGYSNANGYTNGHTHFGNGIRNHKVGPEGDTYLPDGHEQVPPSRNF